jgi:NAD(P)-dependent dehydrogenase (short-subunit alcohol dehydrogenase family)
MNDTQQVPVVLVTGASRGLGRGIAMHLAEEGYSVAVNYVHNRKEAENTVKRCQSICNVPGPRFAALQGDIGESKQRRALVADTLESFGRIDALVNNAGISPKVRTDISEAGEESFDEQIRVNLKAPYFLTQDVVRYWLEKKPQSLLSGGFKIVFVTSISAHTAQIGRGDYCISKAGLSMAAQLWSVRLAAEGIQVVELRPGFMATDMTSEVKEKFDRFIVEGLVPERRWGTPEDVGAAAAAVIRGDLPFTTGSVIHVDGGIHLRRLDLASLTHL